MGWGSYEIRKFFDDDLDPDPKVAHRKAEAIERYIERIEGMSKQSRPDPKDVMETILSHYGLDANYDVNDFVIGEYDGPYGTEDIGYHIEPKKGSVDLYEDRPAHTNEGGYTFTSWAGEWEAWEEEQYNNDPWPKIEHEGPNNGGNPTLWTPDYFRFFEWKDRYQKQRGEGDKELFRFPLYDFLGTGPFVDDADQPIPLEELEVEDEAKDAYDARDPKWWGFLWAVTKHAGWGDKYETWDYFWAGRHDDLCHPEQGETKQAWHDKARQWEAWMGQKLAERDRLRESQGRLVFPEGPASKWPREAFPQRGDLVCTVALDSAQAHSRGVTFYLVEGYTGTLDIGSAMFHIPSTATAVPGQGMKFLVHYVTQFVQQARRVPNLWFAPSRDPKTWKRLDLRNIPLPHPASQSESAYYPQVIQQHIRGPQPQAVVRVGPPPPGWVRKPPTGGRGGGISGFTRRKRRRRK